MRSLGARLWVIWALAFAASLGVALLLVQLRQGTDAAELGRDEAVAARACDAIVGRYRFYVAGWDGSGGDDPGLGRDLGAVVASGLGVLAQQARLAGGIWSSERGALTPVAPGDAGVLRRINEDARGAEQTVLRQVAGDDGTLLLAACPLPGPLPGLTAWTMVTLSHAGGTDRLRLGLALLAALVLGVAAAAAWQSTAWRRAVGRIETALAAHDIEARALPMTGERELDRIVGALNDAGRRLAEARAHAALSERLAALGRVAAGVAHEIRNPLAVMRLKAENALAGEAVRLRPALTASLVQIGRIEGLVGELLAMTQRRVPVPRRVALAPFLEALVETHRERAGAKGLVLALACTVDSAVFDPELIGRALDNLLLNAIRHTSAGGVRIAACASGGGLRLTVADDGPGVDPALRGRLFEPFATGHADGTGLGLAIAREMAAAHGGTLSLAEPGVGGAVFVLELPEMPCPPS